MKLNLYHFFYSKKLYSHKNQININMKKLILLSFLLVCTFVTFTNAQAVSDSTKTHQKHQKQNKTKAMPQPAAQRAVQYSQDLKAKLGLSDDQYGKILTVNTECITRKDALKTLTDAAAVKDGKKQIKDYRSAEFAKILTADQLTKLKAMKANNKQEESKGDN